MIARGAVSALLLILWVTPSSCLEADRPIATTDSVAPPDGDAADSQAPPADTTTAPDTSGPTCSDAVPCPPAEPCHVNICVDGRCVDKTTADGDPCGEPQPCAGPGECAGGICMPGAALPDGTGCDDDDLPCNGGGRCVGGQCEPTGPLVCSAATTPCATWACVDEEGGCVSIPANTGEQCAVGDGIYSGVCKEGHCVRPGMVPVAAGAFTMGCDDLACTGNARPPHTVVLSAFAIDRYEVTNAQYAECVADAVGRGLACPPAEPLSADAVPEAAAARLTWPQAEAMCTYAGKRLCTEAEWEKAARGTDERQYPWGNSAPDCDVAVMWDTGASVKRGCGEGGPAQPGSRLAGDSPYGASDMAGNVAEWVADYYDPDAYAAQSRASESTSDPVTDEAVATHPATRVVRGGSWKDAGLQLRSTRRRAEVFTIFDDDTGVRCCTSLP